MRMQPLLRFVFTARRGEFVLPCHVSSAFGDSLCWLHCGKVNDIMRRSLSLAHNLADQPTQIISCSGRQVPLYVDLEPCIGS